MKILLKLVAVLILVSVIAVVYLASNLGGLIKDAVEQYAPPITETSVTLDSASIMPLSGKGSLGGFNIGQPAGFGDGNILALGEVALELDLASLNSDTIVVRSILIDTPELHYVQNEAGNNLQALANTIQRNTVQDTDASSPSTTEADTSADKKIIIDVLTIKATTVSVMLPQLPDRPLALTLPTIEIKDIGRKSGGERISDAMGSITRQLNRELTQAIANSSELQQQIKQQLEAEARKRAEQEVDKRLEEKLGSDGAGKLKQLLKNR